MAWIRLPQLTNPKRIANTQKPSTIGKINQWIDGTFRNLLKFRKNDNNSKASLSNNLSVTERLESEYWILANAIFELILGISPYFFLSDADDTIGRNKPSLLQL